MRVFFNGRRRKLGLLLLVIPLATLLFSMSGRFGLVGYCKVSKTFDGELQSALFGWSNKIGGLKWEVWHFPKDSGLAEWQLPDASRSGWYGPFGQPDYDILSLLKVQSHWQCCGVHVANGTMTGTKGNLSIPISIVVAPFWAIVVPLSLISFWLLLSKTHKSTQLKVAEPVAIEGA